MKTFFVDIIGLSHKSILELEKFDLDIFRGTTHKIKENGYSVEGLLTLKQIDLLVEKGYQILIKEESSKKFRAAKQVTNYEQWKTNTNALKVMEDVKQFDFINGNSYLNIQGINDAIEDLALSYPSIVELVVLKEKSRQGRSIKAVRINDKSRPIDKDGILLLGGVHAREIVNPDLLISLAVNLCEGYTNQKGLKIDEYFIEASKIQKIIETLDVFIFPLVNPDGRIHVQTPTEEGGEPRWRKNMYANPNSNDRCTPAESEGIESNIGVDLNRNYEHLWNSNIGSRTKTCSINYRGEKPFSEPETRNVKMMIEQFANIKWLIDVHSKGAKILYPWGFDEDQTEDPNMSFLNKVYDNVRGKLDDSYKEYIKKSDLVKYIDLANKTVKAIKKVRNNAKYEVQQSALTGLTSASSDDYCYSLSYIQPNNPRKIMSYTFETAEEFQPDFPTEGIYVIREVSAGLIEFLFHIME